MTSEFSALSTEASQLRCYMISEFATDGGHHDNAVRSPVNRGWSAVMCCVKLVFDQSMQLKCCMTTLIEDISTAASQVRRNIISQCLAPSTETSKLTINIKPYLGGYFIHNIIIKSTFS